MYLNLVYIKTNVAIYFRQDNTSFCLSIYQVLLRPAVRNQSEPGRNYVLHSVIFNRYNTLEMLGMENFTYNWISRIYYNLYIII